MLVYRFGVKRLKGSYPENSFFANGSEIGFLLHDKSLEQDETRRGI